MMANLLWKFTILISICTFPAYGEPIQDDAPKDEVDIEWDTVKGAASYEIEFTDSAGNIRLLSSEKNSISGDFLCGHYSFRARSLNKKKIHGAWGKAKAFDVPLKEPKQISPEDQSKIESNAEDKSSVVFQWATAGNGAAYHIEVFNSKHEIVKAVDTNEHQISIDLPVAAKYVWKLSASSKGCSPDASENKEVAFELIGNLSQPKISKKESIVSWTPVPFATSYDYRIESLKEASGDKEASWEDVESKEGTESKGYFIRKDLPLAKYRMSVVAKGPLRTPSTPKVFEFSNLPPEKLQLDYDFLGTYMFAHKKYDSVAKGLAVSFDGYILNNYMVGGKVHYKNIGLFADYQQGDKEVYFPNPITQELVALDLKTKRSDVGVSYDHFVGEYGFSLKAVLARDDITLFTLVGPEIVVDIQSITTLGLEIGPKYKAKFVEFYVPISYGILLKSSPNKLSPYTQIGLGVFVERHFNQYVSGGVLALYDYMAFSYTDEANILYSSTITTEKFGFFIKTTIR